MIDFFGELTDFIVCFAAGPTGLCPEDAWWGSFLITRGGSPRSTARTLEAAEERLREALADGLARVSFKINGLIL